MQAVATKPVKQQEARKPDLGTYAQMLAKHNKVAPILHANTLVLDGQDLKRWQTFMQQFWTLLQEEEE